MRGVPDVSITWTGRNALSRPAQPAQPAQPARDDGGSLPIRAIRPWERSVNVSHASHASHDPCDPRLRLVRGDALDVARALASEGLRGKVDLVYIDPPFASNADY